MRELIITANEIENEMVSALCIEDYNSIRFFNGNEEVDPKNLKMVIYQEAEDAIGAEKEVFEDDDKNPEIIYIYGNYIEDYGLGDRIEGLKCAIGQYDGKSNDDDIFYWFDDEKFIFDKHPDFVVDYYIDEDGNRHPAEQDTSHFSNKIPVTYISVWDEGAETIESKAFLNIETGYIEDIEMINVEELDVLSCTSESIAIKIGDMTKVIDIEIDEENNYYIDNNGVLSWFQNKKIDAIHEDIEKTLPCTRWESKEALEAHLKTKYQLSGELDEIDESGLVSDYAFLAGIFKDYGYIDIYFLKVPYGEKTLFITEVSVSKE